MAAGRIEMYVRTRDVFFGIGLQDSEHPEERTDFRHPRLLAWVGENRGRILPAALTLLRAYVAAGRPVQRLPGFGSFEEWSDLVRWRCSARRCAASLSRDDPRMARGCASPEFKSRRR